MISSNKALLVLFKLLKKYHHDVISILIKYIATLGAWLGKDTGFDKNLGKIKDNTQRIATVYDKRKRNNI